MVTQDLEKQLLTLETEYWQALKDRNAAAALRLTDDPCIVAGSQGVSTIDHDQFAGMLERTSYTLESFEITNPQVRLIGTDVAILAYDVKEELTVDGQDVTLEAADASTWVRRGGHWYCALHTESLFGDPFGRDRRRDGPASAE